MRSGTAKPSFRYRPHPYGGSLGCANNGSMVFFGQALKIKFGFSRRRPFIRVEEAVAISLMGGILDFVLLVGSWSNSNPRKALYLTIAFAAASRRSFDAPLIARCKLRQMCSDVILALQFNRKASASWECSQWCNNQSFVISDEVSGDRGSHWWYCTHSREGFHSSVISGTLSLVLMFYVSQLH